jgi:hypothetical protein
MPQPANSRGGCVERMRRTIKEEEIDLSEHEHYTAALCELALAFAGSGSPRFESGGQHTDQIRQPRAYLEP